MTHSWHFFFRRQSHLHTHTHTHTPGFQAIALCTAVSPTLSILGPAPPLPRAKAPALDQGLTWKKLIHGNMG